MTHATTVLSFALALGSAWALLGAREEAALARMGTPGLPEPRGAELSSSPAGGAPAERTSEHVSDANGATPTLVRSGDAWQLDFALLEFDTYDPPDLRPDPSQPLPLAAFPEAAQKLHGERVALSGFVQVTSFAAGRVQSFVLARFPAGCCFGGLPQYDEWVDVELARDAPARDSSRPAQVVGRFEVGEVLGEDGYVISLYRLREARLE